MRGCQVDWQTPAILENIFSWLGTAGSIVRCGSVNKAWLESSDNCAPRRLSFGEEDTKSLGTLHWLQAKQKRDMLRELTDVSLEEDGQSREELWWSVVTLLGCSPISRCTLNGKMVTSMVNLLPACLTTLRLENTSTGVLPLRRFHGLECLSAEFWQGYGRLPHLLHLDIYQDILDIADDLPVHNLLPVVEHIEIAISGSFHAQQVLQQLVTLPCLVGADILISGSVSAPTQLVVRIPSSLYITCTALPEAPPTALCRDVTWVRYGGIILMEPEVDIM